MIAERSPRGMEAVEDVDCPYCGVTDSRFWASEGGYTAVKCNGCGLVYVNPRPNRAAISDAVQLGVHATPAGQLNVLGQHSPRKVTQFEQRVLEIFRKSDLRQRPVKWLDIGTGYGELLLALQRITPAGSAIEGVEPCRPKLESARRLGLRVTGSGPPIAKGEYDFVSLINVFSHLPDPQAFLSEIRPALAARGEILLVTGNGGDVQPEEYTDPFFFPDHLIFAGEKHIAGMLERAGFRVLMVRKYRNWLPRHKGIRRRAIDLASHVVSAVSRERRPFRSMWVRQRRAE